MTNYFFFPFLLHWVRYSLGVFFFLFFFFFFLSSSLGSVFFTGFFFFLSSSLGSVFFTVFFFFFFLTGFGFLGIGKKKKRKKSCTVIGMGPPNSVKNNEWWKLSDSTKQPWYLEWWVMSDGNLVIKKWTKQALRNRDPKNWEFYHSWRGWFLIFGCVICHVTLDKNERKLKGSK